MKKSFIFNDILFSQCTNIDFILKNSRKKIQKVCIANIAMQWNTLSFPLFVPK